MSFTIGQVNEALRNVQEVERRVLASQDEERMVMHAGVMQVRRFIQAVAASTTAKTERLKIDIVIQRLDAARES